MRRYFLIFLVVMLPFQFAWAGAAAYCQHEAAATGLGHFGHHEHRHGDAGSHDTARGAETGGGDDTKAFVFDSDCGICHMASVPFARAEHAGVEAAMRIASALPAIASPLASHSARAPDRPQWRRPA